MIRPTLALLFALAAATGFARVGEPAAKIAERFGKAAEKESPKGKAVWFIETANGPLVYTVTLNAKGISIAEGIKPLKRAILPVDIAQDFINDHLILLKDSKTARRVLPGGKYEFAGQTFVCGEQEFVMVDEAVDLLLIWARAGVPLPSVMAVTREMMQPAGG